MSDIDQTRDQKESVQPKVIFKYLSPGRISVLRDLLIRFTQATSLNDTLELKPPVKGVAERNRLEKIAREGLLPALWSQTKPENKAILDEAYPGLSDELGEMFLQAYTQKCASAIEERHTQNPDAVFEKTNENFGILSLSETAIDVRMWGHYADGGRGFLIEFNPAHPWFHGKREARDSFRHLRKVEYVSSRSSAYLLDTTETDFLYTKWNMWEDEREWRIIRCFNDAEKKLDEPDPYQNDILLFSIPPDSIKSIIVGFSASSDLESSIHKILSDNPALSHVTLRRATQSSETGQVSIVAAKIPAK